MLSLAIMTAMSTHPSPEIMAARQRDWRIGPVIYQVFPDRFERSERLAKVKSLIKAPRTLKEWSELPKSGTYDETVGKWSHEIEFWGGDLAGLQKRLDYISQLGVHAVYLTPIFEAYTNHRYDTQDYRQISPELGSQADLDQLIRSVQDRKLKLILDGVFNHMGKTSPRFQAALKDPKSPYRDWFEFNPKHRGGYLGWFGVGNLPALRLESPKVRNELWKGKDSIVRHYLRRGIDGWRLDVAFDLGPKYLADLRQAAHQTKPGSAVIGEINGYPAGWFKSVDGVFNFHFTSVADQLLKGNITGGRAGQTLRQTVEDAGIENLLRSWLLIDNHDTARAANQFPDLNDRKLVTGLQMTLPGAPVLYYGTELGMTGHSDPANRAPMRWDLVPSNPPDLKWIRQLLRLRNSNPALRYGDFIALPSDRLLAFSRTTDKVRQTIFVVANPTREEVSEAISIREGRLLSYGELEDVFTKRRLRAIAGMAEFRLPPRSIAVFKPVIEPIRGYSPYRRLP